MQRGGYQESYLTCPYDRSHRLLAHRYITHLTRCRRNHPNAPTASCPFNGSHIMPAPELNNHVENCPDRDQMDNFVTYNENLRPKIVVEPNPVFEDEEELWETNTPAYDPAEYCAKNKVLLRLDVGSKTQRRNHIVEQRERFQRLEIEERDSGGRHVNTPRTQIHPPPMVVQPKEEPPSVITNYFQELSFSASGSAARVPGAASIHPDEWHQVPTRGRGRGNRNN